jgi:hypothetical protein
MNLQMETKQVRRTEELGFFFEKYPEVPKEVLIKEDILRLGVQFSPESLEISKNYQTQKYPLFSFDRSKVADMKRQEYLYAPEDLKIIGGRYNLRPTVFCTRISTDSPYIVKAIDGKLFLCDAYFNDTLADVKLRRRPRYYDLTFDDGVQYCQIAALNYWGYHAITTVLQNCQYWGKGEECKFCDINVNVRQHKSTDRSLIVEKKLDRVVKVMDAIFCQGLYKASTQTDVSTEIDDESEVTRRPRALVITGGTISKQLRGRDDTAFYSDYIRAVRERVGNKPIISASTHAKNKEDCKRLRDAGADIHLPNIEVWDKRLFPIICPGKDKFVGRDEWIKRVIESVDVWGECCVGPAFVSGVELAQPYGFKDIDQAVDSTGEGLDYLMSYGVVPRFISWCVEPLSDLGKQQPAPLEYYIKIDKKYHELMKKHRLQNSPCFGPEGPGRAVITHSAYMDMAIEK